MKSRCRVTSRVQTKSSPSGQRVNKQLHFEQLSRGACRPTSSRHTTHNRAPSPPNSHPQAANFSTAHEHDTLSANSSTANMATELTVQSERAFQKQPHIFLNSKRATGKSKVGKGGRRWYKDVGLGFRTPKTAIDGSYIGKNIHQIPVAQYTRSPRNRLQDPNLELMT